ncbi:uncharacterized protein LOC100908543 [Galendromus occidentalis]|uniref:Uncharacterized protein LOC100908543 n=1 Tax=Galendromus occidentalis TaxID=34638 RepID=A0AAJ6VWR9_9ACAR|nr:uncharacterized protein LOC100908543 [Galendromus occidentalis]
MIPAGRVYVPAVRIDFSNPQECQSPIDPRSIRAIYLASNASLETVTSTISSTDVAQPNQRTSLLSEKCGRVCPTATYLVINFVWMSTGIAGIALGNLVNRRYFSILLLSVFALMIAVIYRFFYDLEHMDTTPSPAPDYTSTTTPTHSHRSLPPAYSTIVRSETPPPSYQESLTILKAGNSAFRVPTISASIRAK